MKNLALSSRTYLWDALVIRRLKGRDLAEHACSSILILLAPEDLQHRLVPGVLVLNKPSPSCPTRILFQGFSFLAISFSRGRR